MNKERMEESSLCPCQFEIKMIGNIATCHSRKRYLGYGRNKLYYFETYIVYLHFCESSSSTLDISIFH